MKTVFSLILAFTFLVLTGCTQFAVRGNGSSTDNATVEVTEEKDTNSNSTVETKEKKEEFAPHTIKANRNKRISVFIGKLEDRMFYAIGVIKWLESNGYKIIKIQTTNSEEEQLFSDLKTTKKTSYIEWKLHQCCKDEFPFSDSNSYKEILKKLEGKVLIPAYAPDQNGCEEFSIDHNQDHVLCMVAGPAKKISISETDAGMKKIEMYLPPINYQEQLSLVDYIDGGQIFAKEIKK